jgi:hypothetical protein
MSCCPGLHQTSVKFGPAPARSCLIDKGAMPRWPKSSSRELYNAERWRSPAAGSGSDKGADAVGSQVQCFVRRPATISAQVWNSPGFSLARSEMISGTATPM